MPPYPADEAPKPDIWNYLGWANQNVANILQPQFFQYVKGDQWVVPGEPEPVGPQVAPFDPTQFVDWTDEQIRDRVPPFTADEKQKIHKAKADKRRQDAQGNRPARGERGPGRPGTGRPGMPGGGGGFPGGGGVPDYGPNDPERPTRYQYPIPGVPGGPRPGGMVPPGYEGDPYSPGGMGMGTGTNATFPIPPAPFNPQTYLTQNPANSTITCWGHDDSVQPGQVYRYRIAYIVKNPVYGMPQMSKDPKVAEKFGFQSKFTDWSNKVEMLWTVSFWVAGGPRTGNTSDVNFQVFRWQAGDTKTHEFKLSPGDPVGKPEAGVDFSTGWTLVDIGWDTKGQSQWYVLVMDPAGHIIRRDASDISDERFKKMKEQARASGASASALAP
jgi:hypothetical protein